MASWSSSKFAWDACDAGEGCGAGASVDSGEVLEILLQDRGKKRKKFKQTSNWKLLAAVTNIYSNFHF